jgi:hypothetical protein
VIGERTRCGRTSAQTAKQPLPEHRIIRNLSGFAKKVFKHKAGEWRLAPGGVAVYSLA